MPATSWQFLAGDSAYKDDARGGSGVLETKDPFDDGELELRLFIRRELQVF